jgi:HlyD family secretion protein
MTEIASRNSRAIRRHLIVGGSVLGLCILAGGVGANTELSGAIIASGSLVVESNIKKVQHPVGGVVGELLVEEGSHVAAGQLVLRLDATGAQANLDMVTKSLWELSARRARLDAERDGAPAVVFPSDLRDAATRNPDLALILSGEARLFQLRRDALLGQKSQLRERIGQLEDETKGLVQQAEAKDQETDLVKQELVGVEELWRKSLIPFSRLTALQRESARLTGERGVLVATIARTKGKISETELQVIQLDQNLRSEVAKELADIRAKVATLVEQKITAMDQLKRIDIRSPQAGFVHELAVHTKGGVVSPGEPIMLIVPDSDALVVEVRVAPKDIDQLHFGQVAALRFPSFNQRTTPEITGKVTRVAADVTEDKRTGSSFFLVRIAPPADQISRLGPARLVPGMPADAYIRTGERTILSYLMKPLADQTRRAFREK